jgi:hypothetical protein
MPLKFEGTLHRRQTWSFLMGSVLGWITCHIREIHAAAVGIEGGGDALFVLLIACSGAVATLLYPSECWPGPFGVAVGVAAHACLVPGAQASPFFGVLVGGTLLLSLLPALLVNVIYRVLKENVMAPRAERESPR